MHSVNLTIYGPTPSKSSFKHPKLKPLTGDYLPWFPSSNFRKKTFDHYHHASLVCKATGGSSLLIDFDLYDLLGIDSSSDHSEIKKAYRVLQKKCHPDIAGPAGHDMAIILNEAYAILSDPLSRFSYDKEQAKVAEFQGYTGKPIYSVWYGSENEQRAVFVDEVKCIGCLKCAIIAAKTFAIESTYGRARVIAQWADTEDKIQEAIEACPVDCISMVERSKLAALEFLMSKQPRGNVRVGTGNAVGTRISNIFVDVDKFQDKFLEAMDKGSSRRSKESDLQWEAKMSAIQAIRSITNWLYWQPPFPGMPTTPTQRKLIQIAENSIQSKLPNLEKIRDAANARKQARETPKPRPRSSLSTEYWSPSTLILPQSTKDDFQSDAALKSARRSKKPSRKSNENSVVSNNHRSSNPYEWGVPIGMGTIASVVVLFQLGDHAGGIEKHIAGSLFLDVVNSSWLQVILAGVTWYLIGTAGVEIVAALLIKSDDRKGPGNPNK